MCDVDDFDGERWDFWTEKWVKARKSYVCGSCGIPINVGDQYLKHVNAIEKTLTTSRACLACGWAHLKFSAEHSFTMDPDLIENRLEECIENGGSEEEAEWGEPLQIIRAQRVKPAATGP